LYSQLEFVEGIIVPSDTTHAFLSEFHTWPLGQAVHILRDESQTGVCGGHIVYILPKLGSLILQVFDAES
jgi:hypothetical protein